MEREQQERLALEQRIRAMESKVGSGAVGLTLHAARRRPLPRQLAPRHSDSPSSSLPRQLSRICTPVCVSFAPAQVLRGGENLLDKVEALEAQAARQQAALAAQRAAQVCGGCWRPCMNNCGCAMQL